MNGDEENCGEFLEIPKASGYKGRNESSEVSLEFITDNIIAKRKTDHCSKCMSLEDVKVLPDY